AVIADKGYDSDAFLERLKARDIKEIRDCDFALYCEHNLVERFFNKIKHYRAIATRLRQAGQHVSRWRPARLRGPMAQLTTRPSWVVVDLDREHRQSSPKITICIGLAHRNRRNIQLQRDRVPPLYPSLQPRHGQEGADRCRVVERGEIRRLPSPDARGGLTASYSTAATGTISLSVSLPSRSRCTSSQPKRRC